MPSARRLCPEQAAPADLGIAIVGSSAMEAIAAEADRLAARLAARGHRAWTAQVPRRDASAPPPQPDDTAVLPGADVVIVLGGDGTILHTARWMAYHQVPVLGVNLGTLGFLADHPREEIDAAITDIETGRFRLVDHMLFECQVLRAGSTVCRELGMNDVSVLAGPPFSMIEIRLHVDGEFATTYRGDGLIMSTPVGSTAYNLSAGGPIVRKDLDAFIFTPLNPHALTNRPVVDSAERTYDLFVPRPNAGSACVVDGRMMTAIEAGDCVAVRRAAPRFSLVETSHHGYYRTLRDKLHWGGGFQPTGPQATRGGPPTC
ncbi:MAG: NAD(+)/NADH kinase [Planctomycetia bacterium]|nr:NAD(+)/NADH kinase [Planctomycetia bacterium]